MKETLISFQVAKLAKEKGFDIRSKDYRYNKEGELTVLEGINAPTQSLLQKYLRDKHRIYVESVLVRNPPYDKFYFSILRVGKYTTFSYDGIYKDTYEEALEDGLLEALKLIK